MACLGYSLTGQAQNVLTVSIGDNLCVSNFEVTFNDNSTQAISPGCTGAYEFEIGGLTVQYIHVNNVICYVNENQEVIVDNGKKTKVSTKGIRINFADTLID